MAFLASPSRFTVAGPSRIHTGFPIKFSKATPEATKFFYASKASKSNILPSDRQFGETVPGPCHGENLGLTLPSGMTKTSRNPCLFSRLWPVRTFKAAARRFAKEPALFALTDEHVF